METELVNLKVRTLPNESALVYAGVGQSVTNEDLVAKFISRWIEEGLSNEEIQLRIATIEGSGITRRFFPPQLHKHNSSLLTEGIVAGPTKLTQAAIEANGWSGADHLFLATSCPPDSNDDWAKEVAKNCGIPQVSTRYMTCNASVAEMLDIFMNGDLKNEKVVITAFEWLGGFVDPDDYVSQAVFGNGGAAFALRPKKWEFYGGQTFIKKDEDGVIRVPKMYDLAILEEQVAVPSWYKIEAGSEGILSVSKNSVRLTIPKPIKDPAYIEMMGGATARYFGRFVPPIIKEGLEFFKEEYRDFAKQHPIELIVSHQPSLVVIDFLRNLLRKRNTLEDINMPWVLDRAGISNLSSATTLITMAELLNEITKGNPFMVLAYGVGSSATYINLSYKV